MPPSSFPEEHNRGQEGNTIITSSSSSASSISKRRRWLSEEAEDSTRKRNRVDYSNTSSPTDAWGKSKQTSVEPSASKTAESNVTEEEQKKRKEEIKAKFRKLKEMKKKEKEKGLVSGADTGAIESTTPSSESTRTTLPPRTLPPLPKRQTLFKLEISPSPSAPTKSESDSPPVTAPLAAEFIAASTSDEVFEQSYPVGLLLEKTETTVQGSDHPGELMKEESQKGTESQSVNESEKDGVKAGSSGDNSVSAVPAKNDSLDNFMIGVEKQVQSDVLHTLKRLAKHRRKEEMSEKERQERIQKERGRQKISYEEILELESSLANGDKGDEEMEENEKLLALPPAEEFKSDAEAQEFLQALQSHIKGHKSGSEQSTLLALPAAPAQEDESNQAAPKDSVAAKESVAPKDSEEEAKDGEQQNQQIVLLGVDDDENQQGAIDDFLQGSQETEEGYFDLLAKHGSKKDLQPVDHSTIDYPEFKKNLYVQVREITAMKDHEVEAFRKANGNIRIRGKGCPRPIREFSQCGISDQLLKVLQKRGCFTPFPIQMQAIPALMAGRNVIGVAETGSGKTLAYLLPMIRHVLAQPSLKEGEGPIGLVIGPTRELVQQIAAEVRKFCHHVNLRCALVYGGGGIGTQLSELKRGAEIVVGTPGRLTEVLTINRGRICNLRRVTFLVLDEADRMFDLGFGPQVERIINNVRPDRQMAMFSATFPAHIENLAKKALYKPLEIIVGGKGRTAATVTQKVEVFPDVESKFRRLLKLLGEWYEHGESIIIFASQQAEVDDLHLQLMRMGYPSLVLHGGHDQEEREMALEDFKSKQQTILVATSIASRGIDVKSVVLVINYTCPDHLEDYIHRIGRTGRAGNVGVAYTFIMPSEADRADDIKKVLEESGQEVPPELAELVEEYDKRVQLGLVQNKRLKGFRGRGYKFSAAEQSAQQEAKQYWKQELGISVSDDKEEEDAEKDDFVLENPMGPSPTPSINAGTGQTSPPIPPPVSAANAASKAYGDPSMDTLTATQQQVKSQVMQEIDERARTLVNQWTAAILDPVERERQIHSLLPSIRQILANQHPSAIYQTQASVPTVNSPDVTHLVRQALQPLRGASLVPRPGGSGAAASAGKPVLQSTLLAEYVDPVTNNHVCTLSINDYPPQARHKVSHRETLNRIAETTGAALQVRGVYIDAERRRQNPLQFIGTKELHVEIIAPTAVAAQRAKRELRTLLESVAKKQLNIPAVMTRK